MLSLPDHWVWDFWIADDGSWYLFYTGLSRADGGRVQRVGLATSRDLVTWRKHGTDALVSADHRWYHTLDGSGEAEAWRDPWLVRDPEGDGWHMLVTATARDGEVGQRGVLGHAWSPDLLTWRVLPPLSRTDSGLSQLEVPQLAVVDGEPVLLFNCLGPQLSDVRREAGEPGGVWVVRPDALLGPYDVTAATRLTDESLYVGKLVQRRAGQLGAARLRQPGRRRRIRRLDQRPHARRPADRVRIFDERTRSTGLTPWGPPTEHRGCAVSDRFRRQNGASAVFGRSMGAPGLRELGAARRFGTCT